MALTYEKLIAAIARELIPPSRPLSGLPRLASSRGSVSLLRERNERHLLNVEETAELLGCAGGDGTTARRETRTPQDREARRLHSTSLEATPGEAGQKG